MANPSHDNADLMRADFEKWKQDNSVSGGASLLERIYFAGWQQGQSRTTPPSPSTAPTGYAWLPLEPTEAMVHAAEDLPAPRMFGKVWRAMARAALASRPAEVDDEGLPPLPPEAARATKGAGAFYVKWQEAGKDLRGALLLFTAEQYRQGQRDAVSADRARMLIEILYCYSGDDSVCDYQDKIRALMAAPSHTTNKEKS